MDLSTVSDDELFRLSGRTPPAPDKPIDKYTDQELYRAWKPTVAEDIAAATPSALGRVPFVIAGAPADAVGLGMEMARWFDENVLGNETKSREEVAASNPLAGLTSGALERSYGELTGTPLYEAQTAPGRVVSSAVTGAAAGTGIGRVPGAVMGGAGGAGGEYARQKTEGTKWELPASIAGAVAGSAAAGLGTAGVRRMVTPRNIPRENANAAAVLRSEGVRNLTEGQITQRKRLQAAERSRMGIRGDAATIEQFEDLTQAALRRAGIDARRATPEVIDDAFNRFTAEYNGLSSRNVLSPDQDFATDLRGAFDYYAGRVSEPNRAPIILNYGREMQMALRQNGGQIPGETYQSLRSRIQADARSMPTTDPARQTLFDMAEALDSAMERSIGRTNPRDLVAFRDVRRRYRNMLVIEDAIGKGSSEANLGLITGAALENATRRQGKRNWVRGRGDFAELARAAGSLMRELPVTGAAPFNTAHSLFSAAKTGLGMMRMSRPAQRYLTNRLLAPPQQNPIMRSRLPAVPSITQQAPNYTPVIDALSAGPPDGAPTSPLDPQTDDIVRALMFP